MNDQCARPSQLLVKTDIWSLKRIDVKRDEEMECVSQERLVSGGVEETASTAKWWHHF